MPNEEHADPRHAGAKAEPTFGIVSRKCSGIEDLDALDRLRREVFDADARRWAKGEREKNDIVEAMKYWLCYPFFLEVIGHDWRADTTRTVAYYSLNSALHQATQVLMEEAERHGLDPHPLYECARVVQEMYADAPEKYYAGAYDTWPECMGAARYELPAGQRDALRAGEAVLVRLAVNMKLEPGSDSPTGKGENSCSEGLDNLSPLAKAARVRVPSQTEMQAYALYKTVGWTQTDVAEQMQKETGQSWDQSKVSRAVAKVEAFLRAGRSPEEPADPMEGRPKVISVDPATLELGARRDDGRAREDEEQSF